MTVSQIARRMCLTHQSLHATVTRLTAERSSAAPDSRQAWVNRLARGLERSELEVVTRALDAEDDSNTARSPA
jgi:hypothetical protein